jgi:two-component system response regulator RegA
VKPRFLILDDNDVFATTLARSLVRRGFDAIVAQNGKTALDLARIAPFRFVTVDLHLAQDSGLQWIAPLRQALPEARILVLTGYASIATTVQAVKSGADDYLSKPTNVDSILTALGWEQASQGATAESNADPAPLSVDRLEWEHIQRVLSDHQGNISSTARALSMHRRTLQRKLRKKPSAIG